MNHNVVHHLRGILTSYARCRSYMRNSEFSVSAENFVDDWGRDQTVLTATFQMEHLARPRSVVSIVTLGTGEAAIRRFSEWLHAVEDRIGNEAIVGIIFDSADQIGRGRRLRAMN
jgi:hypothetical protein